jgi:hypothetical protein
MNEMLIQTMQILGAYVVLVIVMFLAFNWLTKGFLTAFLKVRASRGGKLLTVIRSVNDVYYRPGYFSGNDYYFKNRKKEDCIYAKIPPQCIYNTMGVQAIEIDEVNSCLFTRAGAIVQGNDPVHVDHLIKRALESPAEKSLLYKIIIVCLIILIIGVIVDTAIIVQIKQILSQTTLAQVINP